MTTKTIEKKVKQRLVTRAMTNASFEGLPKGMTGSLFWMLCSCVVFQPDDVEYPRIQLKTHKYFEGFCIPELNYYPD